MRCNARRVFLSLFSAVSVSVLPLSLSLYSTGGFTRACHFQSLVYLYSVVERRMKEEYARKIHKTRESVGRRAFVCVFLFFEISFSSRSTFLYMLGAFFALFVCGGATQKPEFQPRLEKRETSSPSCKKRTKKRRNNTAFRIKKFYFGK